MIKILKGSRFAVISHRIQQLIPFLIWGFLIFSNSRTITRSKSTKWKAYSNNQTIAYKKHRGCWFTHFTMTTVSATRSGRVRFRLSFGISKIERRNHGGGVADRRAKQRVGLDENDLYFWDNWKLVQTYFVLLHVSYLNFIEIFIHVVQQIKSII